MIIGDTRAGSLPGIEISILPGVENFAERTEISARTVGVQRPPAASAAAAAVDDRGYTHRCMARRFAILVACTIAIAQEPISQTVALFSFHSNPWLNLHHILWFKGEGAPCRLICRKLNGRCGPKASRSTPRTPSET